MKSFEKISATINDKNFSSLMEELKQHPSITRLDLRYNQLGPEAAKSLADWIANQKKLRSLELYGNHLGDEGVAFLCEGLKKNNSLRHLGLGQNELTTRSATFLADLIAHQKIRHLDLYSNDLKDAGVKKLCKKGLSKNYSLKYLDLGKNQLTTEAVRFLQPVLKNHPSLLHLNLQYNPIDEISTAALEDIRENLSNHANDSFTDSDFNSDVGSEFQLEKSILLPQSQGGVFFQISSKQDESLFNPSLSSQSIPLSTRSHPSSQ